MKKTFLFNELDCAVCADKIESAVRKVPGVTAATVHFVTQKLSLEAEDATFDQVLADVKKVIARTERGCEIR